ncbi:MAG: phage tail protein [Desulfobulbaceae bacterium]|nr:phage tail protein [Desulfobulbaceae bacterium]
MNILRKLWGKVLDLWGKVLDGLALARIACASWSNFKAVSSGLLYGRVKVTGRIHFVVRNAKGEIILDEVAPNLVVTTGRAHIANQLSSKTQAAMGYMAVGTGTTLVDASNTALQSEIDRNALTSVTQGTDADANKVIYVCDWAAGDGTGAITEAGIFNSPSAGTMLCRSVFAVKNKGEGDSLTLTWYLTING